MPQRLSNALTTFDRCVINRLRSFHDSALSRFDNVFIHIREMDGKTDVGVHRTNVRQVLLLMRKPKLYANYKKCIFAASEIPLLRFIVGKIVVRPDPENITAITDYLVPVNVKGLRKFLELAAYLHKYSHNHAEMTVHFSCLLNRIVKWSWNAGSQRSFEGIKHGLMPSLMMAIAYQKRPFHMFCDASDFAIGFGLMQFDTDGAGRVICYQSRQLQAGDSDDLVHDK